MKKLKKQQIINGILRTALWFHMMWQETDDPMMKRAYENWTDGIFQILHQFDMWDEFWKLREDPDVMDDIRLNTCSGYDCKFSFTKDIKEN